eukprot:15473617-Alexandrium_andersonii.AAC.2
MVVYRLPLLGPGSDLRFRAASTLLRRHERMRPGGGLVAVTASRDRDAALAYSTPAPAIPAAAALAQSAEGLAAPLWCTSRPRSRVVSPSAAAAGVRRPRRVLGPLLARRPGA